MGFFSRKESKQALSVMVNRIIQVDVGDVFTTDFAFSRLDLRRDNARQIIKSMECVEPVNDKPNNGQLPKEWRLRAKPDLNGICTQCQLGNLDNIARGRVCPIVLPVESVMLSPRERSIMQIMNQGITSSSDIAKELGLSESTVKNNLARVYSKIEYVTETRPGRVEAITYLLNKGLI